MEFINLTATLRKARGKGPSRRLRTANMVPAVVYQRGKETQAIILSPTELVHALAGPLRVNTPLQLTIKDGDKDVQQNLVVVRDHQYDPVTRQLLHVDFLAIEKDTIIDVLVPFSTSGRSAGQQMGGMLVKKYRELPISCPPTAIPASINVDVTPLKIDDEIQVKDLVLDAAVTVRMPEGTVLVVVNPTRDVAADAEDEEKNNSAH
ncbi:MAG: 50S ribosomal protein L25 [Myxococcales bacterium]|jgi:large subunit ribosomal protein L25|nr:50S ribosomal protein L25 [Myxococcales bacterium]